MFGRKNAGDGRFRSVAGTNSTATGMDEPGYESRERSQQYQAADGDGTAPSKTAFSLETAATKQAQHVNANAMSQQVDYDVEDELHF